MMEQAMVQVADWIADRPLLALWAFVSYSLFLVIAL